MLVIAILILTLSGVLSTLAPVPDISLSTSPDPDTPNTESTTFTPFSVGTPTQPPPLGCPKCDPRRCPHSVHECSLNVGLVRDPCGCCANGVCGLREGARCFNETLIADLPPEARALGACGTGMKCVLRTDLSLTDNPEALCSCIEAGPVCGTDNRTHSSSCQVSQESDSLWIKYRGPCRAAPWIVSSPEPEVVVPLGASASFSCESKGNPTPRLHWERVDLINIYDPNSHLPNDDSSMSVQLRGGPEHFMGSTWLQIIATTRQHNGSYACVASNSEGEARAITRLKVTSISEDPDAG